MRGAAYAYCEKGYSGIGGEIGIPHRLTRPRQGVATLSLKKRGDQQPFSATVIFVTTDVACKCLRFEKMQWSLLKNEIH